MKYLFLNRELGHAGKNRRMQGYHGNNYGEPCRWNLEHTAQAVTLDLTPKEYLAVVLDLAKCWHLAMRKWIPVPMESAPSRAPEVVEFEAGFNLAMDGRELPDDASPSAKAGHEIVVWKMATEAHEAAEDEQSPASSPPLTEADFPKGVPAVPNPVQPPIDNAHVAPGCEQFTTEGAVSPLKSDAVYSEALEAAKTRDLEVLRDNLIRSGELDPKYAAMPVSEIVNHPVTTYRQLEPVNPQMKYPVLKKIAKEEGAWSDDLRGNPAIVAAINAKRAEKQPAGV